MTETEYQAIKLKIEKEFPVRCALSKMLDRPVNPKNYKQLEAFDATVAELFLEIALKQSAHLPAALQLVQTL